VNFTRIRRGPSTTKHAAATLGAAAIALALCAPAANAQTPDPATKPGAESVETFYLANTPQINDALEIRAALRDILPPNTSVTFDSAQSAVIVRSTPDKLLVAKKVVADLDRPRKIYRLTYTITESDAGKRIGSQHFALILVAGQRTTLKQGSKVPVATGTYTAGSSSAQTQFTYLDVGINLDATLDDAPDGVRLKSKVEQSSIAESAMGPQDPVVRQSVLEGTSIITLGKPLVLGAMDIPASTRHLDIEAVAELVK